MDFLFAHEKLISDSIFINWKEKNRAVYLAHFYADLNSDLKAAEWQVGYYDERNDLITTFVVGDTIQHMPSAEIFKKEAAVKKLKISDVKLSDRKALAVAAAWQKEKYKQHPIMKGIVILQHIDIGLVWNVTFITASFAALNIKVDAVDGKVVNDSLSTFFDMRAKNTPK